MSTFVLVSKEGGYAVSTKTGSHAPIDTIVKETITLDHATVFSATERNSMPYKFAIKNGYHELPAWEERRVYIGEKT